LSAFRGSLSDRLLPEEYKREEKVEAGKRAKISYFEEKKQDSARLNRAEISSFSQKKPEISYFEEEVKNININKIDEKLRNDPITPSYRRIIGVAIVRTNDQRSRELRVLWIFSGAQGSII
jgi:hypothetical protein